MWSRFFKSQWVKSVGALDKNWQLEPVNGRQWSSQASVTFHSVFQRHLVVHAVLGRCIAAQHDKDAPLLTERLASEAHQKHVCFQPCSRQCGWWRNLNLVLGQLLLACFCCLWAQHVSHCLHQRFWRWCCCLEQASHQHHFWWLNYVELNGGLNIITSSTAQGSGGSFKNRKPIGEVGCCESGMAERSHSWIERWLISLTILSFSDYLPTYLPIYLCIYLSIYLSIERSKSIYLSISLSPSSV